MEPFKNIIDISLEICEGMITYPGNPAVVIREVRGETSIHSDIHLGSHTGTHVDAPRHVFTKGKGVDEINLQALMGKCRVLDMTHVEKGISVNDLESTHIKAGERILAKTKNSLRGFKEFFDDFIYLEGDAAEYLAKIGIVLFGIDSLSVKEKGGEDARAHTSLLERDIVIVEGLDLSGADGGEYDLIVLPLKLKGLDGSPARALLTKN